MLSGATGFCNGTRLWRWEPTWRDTLDVASTRQTPLLRKALEVGPWWLLRPDRDHALVTGGHGEWKRASYTAAALDADGTFAVVYVPDGKAPSVNLAKLRGPVQARWLDPVSGRWSDADAQGKRLPNRGERELAPPGKNAGGDADWVLVLEAKGG